MRQPKQSNSFISFIPFPLTFLSTKDINKMVKKQLKLSRYLKHRSPKTKYQNSRNRSVIKYSFLKSKRSKTTKQKQKSTKEKSTRKYKKTKIKKLKGKRLSKTDLKRRFKSYLKIKSKSKLLSSKSKRSTLSVKPRRSKGQLKSSRLKNGDSLLLIDSKSNKVFTVPKAILIKSSFQMEPNCTLDAAMLDKYSSLLSKYKEDYWLKMNSPKVAEDVDENKLRKLMDYQPTTLPFSVDNWDSTSLDEVIFNLVSLEIKLTFLDIRKLIYLNQYQTLKRRKANCQRRSRGKARRGF